MCYMDPVTTDHYYLVSDLDSDLTVHVSISDLQARRRAVFIPLGWGGLIYLFHWPCHFVWYTSHFTSVCSLIFVWFLIIFYFPFYFIYILFYFWFSLFSRLSTAKLWGSTFSPPSPFFFFFFFFFWWIVSQASAVNLWWKELLAFTCYLLHRFIIDQLQNVSFLSPSVSSPVPPSQESGEYSFQ